MGRVRTYVEVDGRRVWALFDTGARNTYVVADVAGSMAKAALRRPEPSALGRKTHLVTHECLLVGAVEGYNFSVDARIVPEIGMDEEGKRIEVLFGALALQKYGINVDTRNERLDFTHYPKEFVEF